MQHYKYNNYVCTLQMTGGYDDVDGDCNGDCGAGGSACDGDCAG